MRQLFIENYYFDRSGDAFINRRGILDRGQRDCHIESRRSLSGKTRVSQVFGEHWAIFREAVPSITAKSGPECSRIVEARENQRKEFAREERNPIAFESCRLFVLDANTRANIHSARSRKRVCGYASCREDTSWDVKRDVWRIGTHPAAIARVKSK